MNSLKSIAHRMVALLLGMAIVSGTLGAANSVEAASPDIRSVEAASPDIRNYSARINRLSGRGALLGYNFSGAVAVKPADLSAPHSVSIRYTYDGSSWTDVMATYVATEADGYRSYTFQAPDTFPSFHYYNFHAIYAIRYIEGHTTYWNNNNGANFLVRMSNVPMIEDRPYLLDKSAHILESASPCTANRPAGGDIILKHLAYDKLINVRYTTDGWLSYREVSARYLSSFPYSNIDGTNLERWHFDLEDVPCTSPMWIEFVISYTVNGVTYWDNNFTYNYLLSW